MNLTRKYSLSELCSRMDSLNMKAEKNIFLRDMLDNEDGSENTFLIVSTKNDDSKFFLCFPNGVIDRISRASEDMLLSITWHDYILLSYLREHDHIIVHSAGTVCNNIKDNANDMIERTVSSTRLFFGFTTGHDIGMFSNYYDRYDYQVLIEALINLYKQFQGDGSYALFNIIGINPKSFSRGSIANAVTLESLLSESRFSCFVQDLYKK